MPYVLKRPRSRWMTVPAVCLSLLVAAAPAAARGSAGHAVTPPRGGFPAPPKAPSPSTCKAGELSQPFAQFGDSAYYTPVQGGSFNGPLADWTLHMASVTAGGNPWNLTRDQQTLEIQGGGEAVSPTFCLSNAFPTWRFFLQSLGSSPASALNVWVQWTDAEGNSGHVAVTALDGSTYASWSPSPVLTAGSGLADGATVNAQLVFNAKPGDSWNVDDVYVDPYAR